MLKQDYIFQLYIFQTICIIWTNPNTQSNVSQQVSVCVFRNKTWEMLFQSHRIGDSIVSQLIKSLKWQTILMRKVQLYTGTSFFLKYNFFNKKHMNVF